MKILTNYLSKLRIFRIRQFLKAYSYIIAFIGFICIFILSLIDTVVDINLLSYTILFSFIPLGVIILDSYLNTFYEL